jgi:CHAT domain-containing protein
VSRAPRAPRVPLSPPPRAAARAAAGTLPRVAPPGSAAITYWLGEEQSWAWTLTSDGVELHVLPPRAVVDLAVARLLGQVRSIGADPPALDAAAAALERLVLPAAMRDAATRTWRIVPDGSLGGVPWALLASRRGIESASLLSSLAETADAASVAAAPPRERALRVALFGDPVFGSQDARAPTPAPSQGPASGAAVPRVAAAKSLTESDPREFARLPGTAREVAAIAGLAGDGVVVQATGLQATRSALLQLVPGRIDVLHVATHATIDSEIPELAALVLSRLDAAGRSLPGNVRAQDILGMRTAPALVVLSACDAAAEPAGTAEGRMNLVRAFLASGSRHVVASLWEASDAATVELMTRFYEGLLQQRLDPEAALVRAQRGLAASTRWRDPFYWAGFVITRAAP